DLGYALAQGQRHPAEGSLARGQRHRARGCANLKSVDLLQQEWYARRDLVDNAVSRGDVGGQYLFGANGVDGGLNVPPACLGCGRGDLERIGHALLALFRTGALGKPGREGGADDCVWGHGGHVTSEGDEHRPGEGLGLWLRSDVDDDRDAGGKECLRDPADRAVDAAGRVDGDEQDCTVLALGLVQDADDMVGGQLVDDAVNGEAIHTVWCGTRRGRRGE